VHSRGQEWWDDRGDGASSARRGRARTPARCVSDFRPHQLQALSNHQVFANHLRPTQQAEWVVYAKPPFAGPQQVLDYVGRYTHRIAISNNRLVDMDDGNVRFRYKDYRADRPESRKTMALSAAEFIRRFLLHVLPSGFHRIRYFGPMSAAAGHRVNDLDRLGALAGLSRSVRGPHRDLLKHVTGLWCRPHARDRDRADDAAPPLPDYHRQLMTRPAAIHAASTKSRRMRHRSRAASAASDRVATGQRHRVSPLIRLRTSRRLPVTASGVNRLLPR